MGKQPSKRIKKVSVEYPMCVRHMKSRKDVRLRQFFLCDLCTRRWTKEAFDGNRPVWTGERLKGFCQLCNRKKQVKPRVWFLCDICFRVAGSIARNHVAEKAILDFWRKKVEPRYPDLAIEQNDPSALRPRRDTDVSGEAPLDFLVRHKRTHQLLLGIENKTGRSSMREMSAFQLDLSDCDAILHSVQEQDVPAYVIHAQVLEIWDPPTVGFRTIGLWWTDMYLMSEHFRDVKMRRDERRGAAYFKKKAFQDIDTFPSALFTEGGEIALAERYKREGAPALYRVD